MRATEAKTFKNFMIDVRVGVLEGIGWLVASKKTNGESIGPWSSFYIVMSSTHSFPQRRSEGRLIMCRLVVCGDIVKDAVCLMNFL
jgi:hypothetical protein